MPILDPSQDGAVLSAPDEVEPEKYAVRRNVPISKVHQRTVVLRDDRGNPRIDPETRKPVRRTARFEEPALRALADDANARARLGNLCTVWLGHTVDAETNERLQPIPVGFMRNYRIGPRFDESGAMLDATPHLVADLVIEKKHLDESRTYPHRSTEVHTNFDHPERSQLQGLALLRQPPELEMGLLTYAKDRAAGDLAYGPTLDDTIDPADVGGSDDDPGQMPPVGGEPPQPSTGEDFTMDETQIAALVEQLVPALKAQLLPELVTAVAEEIGPHLAQHIEDSIGDVHNEDYDGEGMEGDEGMEDEEQPVDNCAGTAGDSSTFIPGMAEEERVRNCKGSEMSAPDNAAIASLTAEIRAVKQENAILRGALESQQDELGSLMVRNAKTDLGHKLDALKVEGIEFDPNDEIVTLLKLEPADQDAHINRMRLRYRKTPVGADEIPIGRPGKPGVPGAMSKGDMNKIVAYASRNGLDFAKAKAEMTSKNLI